MELHRKQQPSQRPPIGKRLINKPFSNSNNSSYTHLSHNSSNSHLNLVHKSRYQPWLTRSSKKPTATLGANVQRTKLQHSKVAGSGQSSGNESDELIDAPPVGYEYLEELRVPENQNHHRGGLNRFTSQFWCKLCDCRFSDPHAKELHVKGKRHRLQYKRKVDPNLEVDGKLPAKARRLIDDRQRSSNSNAEMVRQQVENRVQAMQTIELSNNLPASYILSPEVCKQKIQSCDDRYAIAKHCSIYPTEQELQLVQSVVTRCERALKLVSDTLIEENSSVILKGVMRVGALAKGLLLHGDLATNLVILCSGKPTVMLLQRVFLLMPQYLNFDHDYGDCNQAELIAKLVLEEAAITVDCPTGDCTCTISFTSPSMRDVTCIDDYQQEDLLDREKCLEALALLKQAKWFQAKVSTLPVCLIVIRLLRDLCQRLPTWSPFPEYAMELIVHKSVSCGDDSTEGVQLSAGEALRRVFECMASGLILPSGPGVLDPCEKEPTDPCASLTAQEREDITAAAQHALRLIAFRQLHRVLAMDSLPPLGAKLLPQNSAASSSSSFSS